MSVKKQVRNGKPILNSIKNNSDRSPSSVPEELKNKLAAVYDHFNTSRNRKLDKQHRDWFVFHMTDWLADLKNLEKMYACPGRVTDADAADIVAGLLYHGLNHLTAAARLLLDYSPGDVFRELEAPESKDHKSK